MAPKVPKPKQKVQEDQREDILNAVVSFLRYFWFPLWLMHELRF